MDFQPIDLPTLSHDQGLLLKSLRNLDQSDSNISDWEAQFMESCLTRLTLGRELTPKQTQTAEQILERYGF